jgi:dephospho-CoA kinase
MKIMLLAGHSATGKTSAAREIARKFDCELILERAIIDKVVNKRGYVRARNCIKKFGFEPLLEETRAETLKAIKESKKNIILDGVYDGGLLDYLKKNLDDTELLVVGVASNRTMRRHRMMKRTGWPKELAIKELKFIDKIKEKMGAHEVIKTANVKVRNNELFNDFISVLEAIAKRFFG